MAIFQNPNNGYTEGFTVIGAFLGTLFFGGIYFLVKGVWPHAVAYFIIAAIAFSVFAPLILLVWIIYPFFSSSIMETHYWRKGYVEVGRGNTTEEGKNPFR